MHSFLSVMIVVSQMTQGSVFCFFDPTLLNKQDVNNDGYISQDEMQPPPSGGWSEFLQFSDGNGDGRLSLSEAQTALKKTLDLISGHNPFDAGISLADKDSDGFLTQRELSSGGGGGDQWEQFIQDFDSNHDSRLSVEEYSKGIANLGEELGLDQGVLPSHKKNTPQPEEEAPERQAEPSQSQKKESQTKITSSVDSETPILIHKPTVSPTNNSFKQIKISQNGSQNANSQAVIEKTSSALCKVSVLGLLISAMLVHRFI